MTVQPIDREALWHRVSGVLRGHAFVQHGRGYGEHIDLSPQAADYFADRIDPIVMDALAAAEHRIARLEAQAAIRGRAVVVYRERAREAEARVRDLAQEVKDERGACLDQMEQVRIRDARIKAVRDVLDQWQVDGYDALRRRILRALDGEA